jgi:hypothetical protein
MLGARLTACKAHYSMGHYDAAARALARCLAVKGGSSAAHLLGAQVSSTACTYANTTLLFMYCKLVVVLHVAVQLVCTACGTFR